ncbi:hypothetical protein U2T19_004915 [Salmonella enterica]|nr:hypothetical protein [Salmonella enterica]EGI1955539.1 hypothetical protein [Salmonella enterica]EMA3598566.1 hypothetical protein [Salmonella enterica]
MLIILTCNSFLKCGLEKISKDLNKKSNKVVVFDADESLYLFREDLYKGVSVPNLYTVLALGTRLNKKDIKNITYFTQYLLEYANYAKLPIKEHVKELTIIETVIVNAILSGISYFEMETMFNISNKSISRHKRSALVKLKSKTVQELHKLSVLWRNISH